MGRCHAAPPRDRVAGQFADFGAATVGRLPDWAIADARPGHLLPWLPVAFGLGIAIYFSAEREPDWRAVLALALAGAATAGTGVGWARSRSREAATALRHRRAGLRARTDLGRAPFLRERNPHRRTRGPQPRDENLEPGD